MSSQTKLSYAWIFSHCLRLLVEWLEPPHCKKQCLVNTDFTVRFGLHSASQVGPGIGGQEQTSETTKAKPTPTNKTQTKKHTKHFDSLSWNKWCETVKPFERALFQSYVHKMSPSSCNLVCSFLQTLFSIFIDAKVLQKINVNACKN